MTRRLSFGLLGVFASLWAVRAAEFKDIVPILRDNCLACRSSAAKMRKRRPPLNARSLG